jgi:DNA helicase-2/ATP-dependent DNA helicase PcrA
MDDIPPDLIAGRTRRGRSMRGAPAESRWGANKGSAETKWALHNKPTAASVIEVKFRAGTRITHPTWGEGIILDSRIQNEDEIVDVVFESVGIKRLSASLANLKII